MTTAYSTITSKGQITLPAPLRHKLGLAPGLRVSLREEHGSIVIDPPPDMATVRERARAEMAAAGTLGARVEASAGWADAAAEKVVPGRG